MPMAPNLALTHARTIVGISAPLVTVEAHISNGLPGFSMVGLAETAVRESKDRVRSAIINSGLRFPSKRLTVNLAPADLPKHGSRFDLAIAMAILAASKQIEIAELSQYEFMGELALSGLIRAVPYGLIQTIESQKEHFTLVLPEDNLPEAQLCQHTKLISTTHLLDVITQLSAQHDELDPPNAHYHSFQSLEEKSPPKSKSRNFTEHGNKAPSIKKHQKESKNTRILTNESPPFMDVIGQHAAKRALLIAASGGHHCLLTGPPGVGKSMLARQFYRLLPPLTQTQAMETLAIYCCYRPHQPRENHFQPPWRSPHHSASAVALIGGGNPPAPGEISLAHHGALLLDELPEFSRQALEALREPLETSKVHIARAKHSIVFPAQCQIIATMNPCPCGYLGSTLPACDCTPTQIQQYKKKLSGPLVDRFDLMVTLASPTPPFSHEYSNKTIQSPHKQQHIHQNKSKPQNAKTQEPSFQTKPSDDFLIDKVIAARRLQIQRQNKLNHKLTGQELQYTLHHNSVQQSLQAILMQLPVSMRGKDRSLKVARTIADLDKKEMIASEHLLEAISYMPQRLPH